MTFLERERRRLVAARDKMFRDPGQGLFSGAAREFVLAEPAQNLWAGIRDDAIHYFRANGVSWWRGAQDDPTGHLLSSQIACVNHLYAVRQRPDMATAILKSLDSEIIAAELVDDGFVEFEFIGERQYLRERGFTRGAHCTSVDAAMIGATASGERRLFLIEWKYTEAYRPEDKYIEARAVVYDYLIEAADSPFHGVRARDLYFEPFYQLMRQTLLGQQLAINGDHGCSSYRHVHVAPKGNAELHGRITSPGLAGEDVYGAWRSVLRQPELFIACTPEELLAPMAASNDTLSLTNYLSERYWAADLPNEFEEGTE